METNDTIFSWNTRFSRTVMSSVRGFGFSGEAYSAAGGLDEVLHTLQKLNIKRCHMSDVERQCVVGEGGSFVVERCSYAGKLVAVKHLKMGELGSDGKKLEFRLANLLLDLQIMHHMSIQSHPNILNLVGYGWDVQDNSLVPFVMVDYASMGDFRAYLRGNRGRVPFATKLIFIGDVAAGLMALHKCGIVHGDLKLDNVLAFQSWDRPGGAIAKLCDFGHSLITTKDEHQPTRYFGTTLYNAPEVTCQTSREISSEDLPKCDIWAYGLLVWEILKDGTCYFDKSWTTESSHFCSSGYVDRASADKSYENFDKNQLRELAIMTVYEMDGASRRNLGSHDFAMAGLRGLFGKTLQVEPAARPSDLMAFPIMTSWNTSGEVNLSAQLSMHMGKRELTYDIFRYDQGGDILWHYQQQIFREIEKMSLRVTENDKKAGMTLQLAICYILGFGTVPQFDNAIEMISQVKLLGHPVAQIFGDQLCSGILGDLKNAYSSCVIQFLQEGALALTSIIHPALLCASSLADTETVRRLIDEGINTAETTADGCSIFHWLFIFGEEALSVGRRVLDQWDATSAPTRRHSAVQALDQPCTEIRRFHPQWPLEFSGTPLAFAIYAASESAVAALLELGANPLAKIYHPQEPNNRYKSSWTPFHLAASLHYPNILEMLLQAAKSRDNSFRAYFPGAPLGCSLPLSSKLERYAIHGCNGRQRLLETVRFLTASGACEVSSAGMTPLIQAIDFDDYDVISALVTCYPIIVRQKCYNVKNRHEWTLPLHFAAQLAGWSKDLDSAVEILSLIVEHDSDGPQAILVTDSRGRTPLHLAVTGQSHRAAKWLIERGADVNAKDDKGRQPLHLVSAVHTADLLLSSGAQLHIKDKDGLSPLHHIIQRDSLDVLNLFIKNGALSDSSLDETLLHFAILGGSRRTVAALLAGGVVVNSRNPDGETPLHIATRLSRADMVQRLLIAGADHTITNRLGDIPLHIASHMENPTIVKLLLSHDSVEAVQADSSLGISSSKYRQTPLHLAAKTADVTVGKLLLAHRASEECTQDQDGRTPLHVAAGLIINGVNHSQTDQLEFSQLLLRRKEVLLIPDFLHQLPWHLAWKKGNLTLLSLFLSKTYSLAGPQLAFGNQDAGVVGSMLMKAAVDKYATDLMYSLLAVKETLGIRLPHHMESTVRSTVDLALRTADGILETVIDQWKEVSRPLNKDVMRKKKDILVEMLRKHKDFRKETVENFERELFGAAGFSEVLLDHSRDAIKRFIQLQPYYRQEILPGWIDRPRWEDHCFPSDMDKGDSNVLDTGKLRCSGTTMLHRLVRRISDRTISRKAKLSRISEIPNTMGVPKHDK